MQPVFIVGSERSGTTLLAVLMGRHSDIISTPETHFCYDLKASQWKKEHRHDTLLKSIQRKPRFKDLHIDIQCLKERFYTAAPTYEALFHSLLEEYSARSGKSIVAEKSPHHVFYGKYLLESFKKAQIIHIVRDGRDAVSSVLATGWPWIKSNILRYSLTWRQCIKAGLALEKNYPHRVYRIHYEKLLSDPINQLRGITSFLGISFENGLLDTTILTEVVPEWENIVKEKAKNKIDASRIHAWKKHLKDKDKWMMNKLMSPYLSLFDYPDNGLEKCPLLFRIWLHLTQPIVSVLYNRRIFTAFEKGKIMSLNRIAKKRN